jgi:chromosome segregation ATPase
MPPKKKPGKVAKKGGGGGDGDDGPSKQDLAKQVLELQETLTKEREERNYYQLERDKVMTFWEISKRELEDARAEMRNKERQMQELEERTQTEVKVYRQKVKHLLYEHQNNVSLLKTEGETAGKLRDDEHRNREAELRKDKRSLKVELKEQQLAAEDVVRNLKLDHDKGTTRLRQEHERHLKELTAHYEQETRKLREELEVRRKMEVLGACPAFFFFFFFLFFFFFFFFFSISS